MKTVKIIIGLILTFSIVKSCSSLVESEPYSGSMYPIIAIVLLFIPAFLFYSAFKNKNEIPTTTNNTQTNALNDLSELKKSGLLTEDEYNEKVSKLNNEKSELELKNTTEYKQLKNLFDVGVLNQDEFDDKINSLKKVLLDKTKQIENVPEKDNANYYYSDESYNENKDDNFSYFSILFVNLFIIILLLILVLST